jgi:hypothetical protein
MRAARDGRRPGFGRRSLVLGGAALAVCAGSVAVVEGAARTASAPTAASSAQATTCTSSPCKSSLFVNPGLTAGHTFSCPAIQNAKAHISVTNRFSTGALNDTLKLTASGLPPSTGFDVFIVQNSPFDTGFSGFGFAWYQSDLQSDSSGNASITVKGIFDKETFIVQGNSTTPVHTFNVGFWFDSPTTEASKCNSPTPTPTEFNGEQNAGLLAMITQGAPLGNIQ